MNEQQPQIFRKAALDKLSSPEQLDQLMQVTAPRGWIALAACGAVLLAALLWSIFGRIPTKVQARGILIKQGGVFLATSRGDGNVLEILTRTGNLVTNGQTLALISQPELKLRITQTGDTLARLKREFDLLKTYQGEEAAREAETFEKQRATLKAIIDDYGKQIAWLSQRAQTQEELAKKELITKAQVLDTQIKLSTTQHDLSQANVQLRQVDINSMQSQERRRQDLQAKENQIRSTEDQLAYLESLHTLNTKIVSPFTGHVLEVMVKPGQLLTPNTPILSLQADTPTMEARLFLNPSQGKLVEKAMQVAISPVSVKKEEYGFVLAKVDAVSPFPSTPQGMLGVLENQALVQEFSQGGAPIEVIAALIPNEKTSSGFAWSSAKGPPVQITSGTLCDAWITLTNQRPISFVLPILRGATGI